MTDAKALLDVASKSIEASAKLQASVDQLTSAMSEGRSHSGGKAEIHVNAGGVGLWVAVTCCLIAVILMSTCFVLFLNLDRKVDRALDYQTARYMMAPHTKPKDKP